jgi:hypothetical protein
LDREYVAREAFFAAARVNSGSEAFNRLVARVKKLQKTGADWCAQKKIPWNGLFVVALDGLSSSILQQMESQLRTLLYGKA